MGARAGAGRGDVMARGGGCDVMARGGGRGAGAARAYRSGRPYRLNRPHRPAAGTGVPPRPHQLGCGNKEPQRELVRLSAVLCFPFSVFQRDVSVFCSQV